MKAASIIRLAERDGLRLVLENGDKIKAYGPHGVIKKWAPAIRSHKAALIAELGAELKTAKTANKKGRGMLAVFKPDEEKTAKTAKTANTANDGGLPSCDAPDRIDWWHEPVAGWPRSLTIRNMASGDSVAINLRTGETSKSWH